MPTEGEKLDELLSGFIDAELSEAELKSIAATVESDASARKRLEQLRQMRRDVQEVGVQLAAQSALPAGFAERVVAAAQRQAAELGLPDSHPVRKAAQKHDQRLRRLPTPIWRQPAVYVGLAASLAALWLLAAYVPGLLKPASEPSVAVAPSIQTSPELNASTNTDLTHPLPASVAYIGQSNFKVKYALVVDVQVTKQAIREDTLGNILVAAGIQPTEPITVNPEIEGALAETRMIVQPQESARTEDTIIFFMRADSKLLDAALQTIWSDKRHFPNVRLDLAIDNPQCNLIEKIARSTGNRFTTNDSFAAPIATEEATVELPGGASPFPGSSSNIKYVSSKSRDRGWSGGGATLVPSSEEKSSVLVVLHVVE